MGVDSLSYKKILPFFVGKGLGGGIEAWPSITYTKKFKFDFTLFRLDTCLNFQIISRLKLHDAGSGTIYKFILKSKIQAQGIIHNSVV